MNEVTVDWEFEQQAVESQLSRPALVHGCIGTLGWRACIYEHLTTCVVISGFAPRLLAQRRGRHWARDGTGSGYLSRDPTQPG